LVPKAHIPALVGEDDSRRTSLGERTVTRISNGEKLPVRHRNTLSSEEGQLAIVFRYAFLMVAGTNDPDNCSCDSIGKQRRNSIACFISPLHYTAQNMICVGETLDPATLPNSKTTGKLRMAKLKLWPDATTNLCGAQLIWMKADSLFETFVHGLAGQRLRDFLYCLLWMHRSNMILNTRRA